MCDGVVAQDGKQAAELWKLREKVPLALAMVCASISVNRRANLKVPLALAMVCASISVNRRANPPSVSAAEDDEENSDICSTRYLIFLTRAATGGVQVRPVGPPAGHVRACGGRPS